MCTLFYRVTTTNETTVVSIIAVLTQFHYPCSCMAFSVPKFDLRLNTPKEKVPGIDDTEWQKDEELTTAYRDFVLTEPRDAGKGVERSISCRKKLLDDDTSSPHVVTRREQRKVVEFAFKKSRELLKKASLFITVRGSPVSARVGVA